MAWKFYYCFLFSLLLEFSLVFCRSTLIHLDEDNWQQILEGEWMVEFFAPWCPACKALQPVWSDFAQWSDDLGIRVGQVDVTANPGLSGRFMVTALPTIFHIKEGTFRQFRGSREKEALMSFVEEKKWQSLDEIPSWKSPSSFQMSVVSYFFKLSMVLRSIHNKFIEEYGLPYWGSYIIFGLLTILVGALLGIILVCVIDLFFPPKPSVVIPKTKPKQSNKDKGSPSKEEEEEDVIVDDSENVTEEKKSPKSQQNKKRKPKHE